MAPQGWCGWSLVVACAAWGCTLTAEPFEPGLVDRSQVASTPGGAAADCAAAGCSAAEPPPLEGAAGAGGVGEPLPGEEEGEAGSSAIPFEPGGATGGELGGTSGGAAPADPAGADAGAGIAGGQGAADGGGPPASGEPCPGQVFGGSCYEFFSQVANWSAAELRCVAWGGHLASVESSAEDELLEGWPEVLGDTAAGVSGIWLGGTDAADDGEFVWSDGSPMAFEGWAANQPDNGVGVDCIEKRNDGAALWYDSRCADQHPFVCEKPR